MYIELKDILLNLNIVDKHSLPIPGKTTLDVYEYELILRLNKYNCNKSGQNTTIYYFKLHVSA
jgi:hypothetical protein